MGILDLGRLILPRNKAVESIAEMDQTQNVVREAKELLRKAGIRLRQSGSEYLGTACVHYYVKSIDGNQHVYETIEQLSMDRVPEGFADYGHKRLMKALMGVYGRERKTRK